MTRLTQEDYNHHFPNEANDGGEPERTVEISASEYAEYQRLRSDAWKYNRKEAVLEELSDMDMEDGNDWLDDEAEFRMESGHRDSYQMEG